MGIGPFLLGDVKPRKLPIATAQAVAQYDLVGLAAGTIVRATDTSWAGAVSTPSAPTLADGAVAVGSPLTHAATHVKISVMFPWGEGPLSNAASVTPTAGALIACTLPALPAPGLYFCIYVETAAGSGTYELWGISYSGAIQMIGSYGTGRAPAASPVSCGALQITQYNFAQTFAGLSHQTKAANVARVYGSSEDGQLVVHSGGVFLCPCASATFTYGQPVGPDKDTGNDLLNQQVVAVADISLGIGYVTEPGTSVTAVKVEIVPQAQRSWRTPLQLAA